LAKWLTPKADKNKEEEDKPQRGYAKWGRARTKIKMVTSLLSPKEPVVVKEKEEDRLRKLMTLEFKPEFKHSDRNKGMHLVKQMNDLYHNNDFKSK